MQAPEGPIEKRVAEKSALRFLESNAEYRLLSLLQAPFGAVFWLIEQRKGRIEIKLANIGASEL